MILEGSCHCGDVKFRLESNTPYPYQHCYCSICRKTAGGGGYAVNIMGWTDSLEVEGRENIRIYHARLKEGESPIERHFCGTCGSALWVYHEKWADLIHPFASAIDTALPTPDEKTHIMLEFKAEWVEVPEGENNIHFDGYPDKAIEAWHDRQTSQKSPENPET